MKKILFLLVFIFFKLSTLAQNQYSSYYINHNINANINKNVTVNGVIYENKTITTIDYGSLELANAQKEKNRLEKEKFNDEKQKNVAVEISEDPLNSYKHGKWITISSKFKDRWNKKDLNETKEYIGFKEFRLDYLAPNELLFDIINIYHIQNTSSDNIKTDVYINLPYYNKNNEKFIDIEEKFDNTEIGIEKEEPNETGKIRKIFYHKKDLNRATVFGNKGYRFTLIWEDKFEIGITDNYLVDIENFGNGYSLYIKVRYNGNKSEIDFEQLEGRRHYLKNLIEKIISTAKVSDLKYY